MLQSSIRDLSSPPSCLLLPIHHVIVFIQADRKGFLTLHFGWRFQRKFAFKLCLKSRKRAEPEDPILTRAELASTVI